MTTTVLKALLHKELLIMRRNPLILRVIIMMPLAVMLVLPLVANLDVRHVGVAIADLDRSQLSRRICADMDASEYLTVAAVCDSYEEGLKAIENGNADVLVTVPANFERDLTNGLNPKIDLAANGVNATKGGLGASYTASSISRTLAGGKSPDSYISYFYNPTLDFRNFMIPGLMVMLLIIICGFLPALNLVGEKESGSIEAMNVTPVGKMTFVLSKLIPYWVAGLIVVTIAMLIGRLVYGLVPAGNFLLIYLASILFTLVMSGLGVTIANQSSTILQSILVMFAIIMVFQLMSGLFTPVSSMPGWAQTITLAVPPRYFIEIVRSVYLKGTPLSELWHLYAVLGAMALSLCVIAAATYRKQS